jgi:hypothetical protein
VFEDLTSFFNPLPDFELVVPDLLLSSPPAFFFIAVSEPIEM